MTLALAHEAHTRRRGRRGLRGQATAEAERVGPGPRVLVLVLIADVEDGVVGEEERWLGFLRCVGLCCVLLVPNMPLANFFADKETHHTP